ncbi:Bug family tripartite tricarboxylate transporter substrate binding protein [Natrialbaceae archaeon A-CW3]
MLDSDKVKRRSYLKSVGVLGTVAVAGCTSADNGEYPSEDIVLVNPYPPGGGTDVYFSPFVDAMSDEFGVSVSQEYEAGAEGAIAHREMYQSDSQYRFTNINIPLHTLVQIEQDDPGYDLRDLTGIGGFAWDSVIIVTPADSEYDSLEPLLEAFQSGDLDTLGGVGAGNTFHMTAWQMQRNWDLDYDQYVGYDGGGSLISAVLRGEVDAGVVGVVPATQYVEEGEVNGVIVVGEEPHPSVPDVDISGNHDLESVAETALFTRSLFGTPALEDENQERIAEGFQNVLESDEIQDWSSESGNPIIPEGPAEAQDRLDLSFDIEEIYDEFREATGE